MKQWLIYPLAATTLTVILHWIAHVQIGFAALIAFIGWPVIGTLVTIDDDLPGGFSNPDGTRTPDWERAEFWGKLTGRAAIVCFAFLFQIGLQVEGAGYLVLWGIVCAALSFALLWRARKSISQ